MGYSKHIYNLAKSKLNDRKNSALNIADFRKEELYFKFPRLNDIDKELCSVGISTAKAVLYGKDAGREIALLREKSLELQEEYKNILVSNGYAENYLEPHFACDKCKDEGFIELNNKTITCECFKKLLSACACEELNKVSPLTLSTFDTFNLSYYSDKPDDKGNIPYVRMSKIYDYCLNYAKNFTTDSKGIIMKGNTGLGKTHLSLAIANEVINRGFSVAYVSAPDILAKLEKEHFSYGYSNEQAVMQSLLDCDLLILDDLGTEFATQFTSATVYNLFNSRVNMKKPMIINTNLTPTELEKNYSQRFNSRVMASCVMLDFIGNDIRAMI